MKITSQKIGTNNSLNKIELPSKIKQAVFKVPSKNVIFAVDVSGSMYYELPKMRTQLKNKIPSLIGTEDTITIIWFSGNNQAGVLQEGVKVTNLADLQKLNDAIDRFLKPVGLTAFLPPLELTENVITNLKGNGKDFSFIFLSDGYNNDSVWGSVIKKVVELEPKISASTFIEYGYYADSSALTEMAEKMGGEKIFSKDFDSYEQSFEKALGRETAKKIEVDISSVIDKVKYQMLFGYGNDGSIITFSTVGKVDKILIPENLTELYFISRYKVADDDTDLGIKPQLISAHLLADRLKYTAVEDFLIKIGDVALLEQFGGAFGKEKLNALKDNIKDSALDETLLFSKGRKEGYKINPKQFCIIDLITILQQGDNKFYPFHPDFNYNRVSAKKTTKVELSDEVVEQLSNAKTLAQTQKVLSQIESPEFVYPENSASIGFDFDGLVWNSTRANLSVKVQLFGKVKLPSNDFNLTEVDSFLYRNYTLIKDGIANISVIPVSLDSKTFDILFEKGLLVKGDPKENIHLLDISSLPTINRSMTVNVSGKKLAQLEFDLINVQVAHKYLKHLKDIISPKTNDRSAEVYSPEAAEWLKSIGVSDYNGFSPKTETVESDDFYMAPSLVVKIQNTSTIPTVKSVVDKMDLIEKAENDKTLKAPKLNLLETIMKSSVDEFNPILTESDNVDKINTLTNDYNEQRKLLLSEIAAIKFGVILSRTWFKEFETMEENTIDGYKFKNCITPLNIKFEFKEEKVKV